MLDSNQRFVPLPQERILYTSPSRTTLSLQTPNSYPGKEPLAINSSSGKTYVTNQRVGEPQLLSLWQMLTLQSKGRLPTHVAHSPVTILLRSHTKSTRYPRRCPVLRCKFLDRDLEARHRWQHTSTPCLCKTLDDLQGGRCF